MYVRLCCGKAPFTRKPKSFVAPPKRNSFSLSRQVLSYPTSVMRFPTTSYTPLCFVGGGEGLGGAVASEDGLDHLHRSLGPGRKQVSREALAFASDGVATRKRIRRRSHGYAEEFAPEEGPQTA